MREQIKFEPNLSFHMLIKKTSTSNAMDLNIK